MQSKHYFEFKITDDFERRFQHRDVGEYLVKYTPSECQCYFNNGGIFRIEFKNSISVFVKLKLYEMDDIAHDGRCVFSHSSVLQSSKMKLEADLKHQSYEYGSRPFICSVEIILYEEWHNIKTHPILNVGSKHYFKLKPTDNFKRRFQQLNVGEYLMAYSSVKAECHSSNLGIFSIEFKSGISLFVKLKLYRVDNFKCDSSCVFSWSSALQGHSMKFVANLNDYNINQYSYKSRSNSSTSYICSVQIIQYEKWQNIQLYPISVTESKHYFELKGTDKFERRFQQLNIGDYLMKFPGIRSEHSTDNDGILRIEFKSCVSRLVIFKQYDMEPVEGKCIFHHSFVLQSHDMTFEVDLNEEGEDAYPPYICSVHIIQYENYKNIQDSAKKMNIAKNVIGSEGLVIERRVDHLSFDMRRLLEEGDLSDVIVSNGSTDLRAHEAVLSARSSVFSKMFQHSMKENLENRITISDVCSKVLKELLLFIYTGVAALSDMKMARDLYVISDKYGMKELQAVCSNYLKNLHLDSVLDILALADLYRDETLKQSALNFISENYVELKRHKSWNDFMKGNQVLALEVVSFALDKRVSLE